MDGERTNAEGVSELVEVVHGGFATGEDDDLAAGSEGGLGESLGLGLLDLFGKVIGMPGAGGIAPRTFHGAALKPYEVGGLAEVAALTLPSVKALVYGKRLHGR
jgi:hypothetical protein